MSDIWMDRLQKVTVFALCTAIAMAMSIACIEIKSPDTSFLALVGACFASGGGLCVLGTIR